MRLPSAPQSRRPWWIVGFCVPPLVALAASVVGDASLNAGRAILFATLVWATQTDLARRRIPNYITYPTFLWLVGLSLFANLPDSLKPIDSILGAAACFGVMLLVFICAGGGGGDVKLAAVIGAALGPQLGLTVLVASHIVAGVAALGWIVVSQGPLETAGTIGRACGSALLPLWIAPPSRSAGEWLKCPLPMSPFFLLGTALTLLLTR